MSIPKLLILMTCLLLIANAHQLHAADQIEVDAAGVRVNDSLEVSDDLKVGNGATINEISTDGTLADDSDTAVPTEKAVKAYIDSATSTSSGDFSTGDIKQTLAVSEPAGWLFLNGQAVSRTGDTAGLFALFGTSFGAGDGSTTFNLPDARGRTLSTIDNMGGISANIVQNSVADSLGGTLGAETHTLTIAEMPSHNHGGATSTDGAHTHAMSWGTYQNNNFNNKHYHTAAAKKYKYKRTNDMQYTESSGNHSHTISSQGGDQAHNNMQPTLFVQTLIKK